MDTGELNVGDEEYEQKLNEAVLEGHAKLVMEVRTYSSLLAPLAHSRSGGIETEVASGVVESVSITAAS